MANTVPVPDGSGSAADDFVVLEDRIGSIEPGKQADFVVVDRAAASATGAAAEASPSLPGSSGGEAALPEPVACRTSVASL